MGRWELTKSLDQPVGSPRLQYWLISGYYIMFYYGFGALNPLLTQYYKSIQLTGTQIGIISAITPVVSIVCQPLWGMICDKYRIRKSILIVNLILAAVLSLLFLAVSSFFWVLFLFIVFSIFQCAISPISDSMVLTYARAQNMPFGNLRLWGAVGYAIAAYFTGLAVEAWGPDAIFYFFCGAFLCSIPFIRGMPGTVEAAPIASSMFSGLKELLRLPRFVLFLFSCFFIFGSVNANNIWFALYYQKIGGTVAGVGLAFLLFAGSEAPCMRLAGACIRRWGLELTILFAGAVSMLRWLWYATIPSSTMIIAFFVLQGLSVGFYLAAAAQFVRENTPSHLQVTALSVFASVGQGLGTMTCNLVAGVLADYLGIISIYWFFGIATMVGVLGIVLLRFGPYRQASISA